MNSVLDEKTMSVAVLDHGYLSYIEHWGSDERIIESARMSTNKGFSGWGDERPCPECGGTGRLWDNGDKVECGKCLNGKIGTPGDEKLLRYLYEHKHLTPFEMCGMTIEVKAPIMVFREWHRHRTQSYNEMSARYVPLPDENYMPTRERIIEGAKKAASNRQAQGAAPLCTEAINDWLLALAAAYECAQRTYETGLAIGVPKELARLPVPVARYTRMRASTNLRNWLAFLTLRMDLAAQEEIRVYANSLGMFIARHFSRTWSLFCK